MEKEIRKYKKHKKGYTISVTYILKKDSSILERILESKPNDPLKFPLHVRVAFLGQNVRIKSRIDVEVSENDYENFINSPDIQPLIQCETESIRHSVKLFEPDLKDNFLISSWQNFYKKWNEPLSICLRESTAYRLETGLREEFQIPDTDVMNLILGTSTVDFESVDYYALLKSNTAIRLQNSIEGVRKMPVITVVDFMSDTIKFSYTYWDWKSGQFASIIGKGIDSASIQYFEDLMSDYERIITKDEKNR